MSRSPSGDIFVPALVWAVKWARASSALVKQHFVWTEWKLRKTGANCRDQEQWKRCTCCVSSSGQLAHQKPHPSSSLGLFAECRTPSNNFVVGTLAGGFICIRAKPGHLFRIWSISWGYSSKDQWNKWPVGSWMCHRSQMILNKECK